MALPSGASVVSTGLAHYPTIYYDGAKKPKGKGKSGKGKGGKK